jgi:uncharacterized protein
VKVDLRAAAAADWPRLSLLNNAEVPRVGPLDESQRDWYLAHSQVTVATMGDDLVGLLVVMHEGCGYASPNYGWFAARHDEFAYVDRIVVEAGVAGRGIGRRLYEHAVTTSRQAGKTILTAEVNVDPPNQRSLAFHERFGFVRVGTQVDERYGTTVAMLAFHLE